MPSDRIFKTGIDEFDRAFDAEVFVLENLARKLKPGDSGTIKLVSELPFCDSCSDVIRQFREMFPNIRLILIDGT
ncbi:MAG: deaminase domain-containing protein [Planctomycetota bacterium]